MRVLSLGEQFQEELIDLREHYPSKVVEKITNFLDRHDIPYDILEINSSPEYSLLQGFFKRGYVLTTYPNNPVTEPIIIGKGVCFDTGGYDIKTHMDDMFFDKNGALLAIATSIDTKISSSCFFVENPVSDTAIRPGSILKESNSGLRVYIKDTDAEGRIGLANLIAYLTHVKGYTKLVTIATLTGAAHSFAGDRTYALVHTNRPVFHLTLLNAILKYQLCLWPAPGHIDYDNSVESKINGADITNLPDYKGAGSQTAFSFLKQFLKSQDETFLFHVDIAPMMVDKEGNGLVWGITEIKALLDILRTTKLVPPMVGC